MYVVVTDISRSQLLFVCYQTQPLGALNVKNRSIPLIIKEQ